MNKDCMKKAFSIELSKHFIELTTTIPGFIDNEHLL